MKLVDHGFRKGKAHIGIVLWGNRFQEMRKFIGIDGFHVGVALVGVGEGVSDVGQSVGKFHEGGVGRLADALVVFLTSSLSAGAPLVVS